MGIKDKGKKLATGASVALATSGLTSCDGIGAVDPLPPALQCGTIDRGQSLTASAVRSNDTIVVDVRHEPGLALGAAGLWDTAQVTNAQGASVVSVERDSTAVDVMRVTLELDAPATNSASFVLQGELLGLVGERCAITRTFTLTINGPTVTVTLAAAPALPLGSRARALIALVDRNGRDVTLEARTEYAGSHEVRWSVTAGTILSQQGNRMLWRLPPEQGLYQAELVADYGDDGLAVDVLPLEVR